MATGRKFPIKIKNFEYNGFFGKEGKGFAPYTGKFVKWTSDPGIAEISCSDGKTRYVPTFAMDHAFLTFVLPQPEPKSAKSLFGVPSGS